MTTLGVPYPADYSSRAVTEANAQANNIAAELKTNGITVPADKEIIALISYLQRLGTDIKADSVTAAVTASIINPNSGK
jgi:cytochrome c oxidase cbb3-type subunit I/II